MGTGGMRWGAGRPGYRAKAEELKRVDVRVWARGGYLRAGRSFSWRWTCGGEPSGSIGVLIHGPDSLTLQYTIGQADARRDGSQTVCLALTRCNFGNTRAWFLCPICRRRAGLLFLRWARFACRTCQKVAYSSQSDDALDQTWHKQRRIEARLGANWARPKGMWQRTYGRLMRELIECQERRDVAFTAAASRLLGRLRNIR